MKELSRRRLSNPLEVMSTPFPAIRCHIFVIHDLPIRLEMMLGVIKIIARSRGFWVSTCYNNYQYTGFACDCYSSALRTLTAARHIVSVAYFSD